LRSSFGATEDWNLIAVLQQKALELKLRILLFKSLKVVFRTERRIERRQATRDYVRDRMLLRAGLPTVRFTGRDCLERPQAVVAECLSILGARS